MDKITKTTRTKAELEEALDVKIEPSFTFRAQDILLPDVLRFWASQVENAVCGDDTEKAAMSRRKAKEARAFALEIEAWQVRNHCKIPD